MVDFRHGRLIHCPKSKNPLYSDNQISTICGPPTRRRGPGLDPGQRGVSESVEHIWSISDGISIFDFFIWTSVKIDRAEIDHIGTTDDYINFSRNGSRPEITALKLDRSAPHFNECFLRLGRIELNRHTQHICILLLCIYDLAAQCHMSICTCPMHFQQFIMHFLCAVLNF